MAFLIVPGFRGLNRGASILKSFSATDLEQSLVLQCLDAGSISLRLTCRVRITNILTEFDYVGTKLKKMLGAALLAAGLIGMASAADAAVYDFTFIGASNYTVTGEFTTNASNVITSASGTVTSINSLDPSGTFVLATPTSVGNVDGQAWDNMYNPGPNAFGGNGIGLDIGGRYATIYDGSSYAGCGSGNTCFSFTEAGGNLYDPGDVASSFSITAVPEPATWAMLLLGFFGVGFMMRSTRRSGLAAVA